jgi:hypothetical protein
VVSASSQVVYTSLSSIPSGIVSSSTQIPALLPNGTVSSSAQLPSGIVSSSTQIPALLSNGTVSASSQVVYTSLSSIPSGIVSSSTQIPALLPNGTVSASSQVAHGSTTGYVANEHINHTTVSISAGSGLTGGGDISATRTLTLDTGSAHFTSGVKSKMNSDGVYSSSAQLVVSAYTNAVDNRVLTSTGAGGINAESNLTFDGSVLQVTGSVGIGIAPVTKLQVNDGTDRNFLITSDATQQGTAGIAIGSFNDAANAYGILSIVSSKTIFNSNVGIGTTSPDSRVHVDGSNQFIRISNAATGNSGLKISYQNSDTHGLHLLYNPSQALAYIDNTYPVSSGQVYGDIYFRQNVSSSMTTRMTIKADGGNVGIGTTNPAYKLDVIGNARIGQNSNSSTAAQLDITAGGDGFDALIDFGYWNTFDAGIWKIGRKGSGGTFIISNYSTGAEVNAVTINSTNNNVGIGTTSPGVRLDVQGADGVRARVVASSAGTSGLVLSSAGATAYTIKAGNADSSLRIDQDGNDRITLASGGNVGIGTTTPAYKLEVNGATNVNGAFSAVTKSFLINHPVKKNYKLQYGSLESPYHGIRLTGDGVLNNGVCEIQLPDYISALVKENEISIQLTNYQHNKNIWVETIDIENNKFIVKTKKSWFSKKQYKFFWSFTAIRKDVSDMEVEFEVQGDK